MAAAFVIAERKKMEDGTEMVLYYAYKLREGYLHSISNNEEDDARGYIAYDGAADVVNEYNLGPDEEAVVAEWDYEETCWHVLEWRERSRGGGYNGRDYYTGD